MNPAAIRRRAAGAARSAARSSEYAVAVDSRAARRADGEQHEGARRLPLRGGPAATTRCGTSASSARTSSSRTASAPCSTSRDRQYTWPVPHGTEKTGRDGRVLEILSEHMCQGWLEGYLLTGRHGLFPCYEAFVPIVDGMMNQYAKFLKASLEVPWRKPISSFNYLLTSEAWRQDHNGFSHQGPGFINNLLTKKGHTYRIYLPPDATRSSRRWRTVFAPRTTSTCHLGQAAHAPVAPLDEARRGLPGGGVDLALGEHQRGRGSGDRPRRRPATTSRSRSWARPICCAARRPSGASGS